MACLVLSSTTVGWKLYGAVCGRSPVVTAGGRGGIGKWTGLTLRLMLSALASDRREEDVDLALAIFCSLGASKLPAPRPGHGARIT